MSSDQIVAKEILRQLGGNRFIAMTGASSFSSSENSLSFRIPMAKNRICGVVITLNASDTYDVKMLTQKPAPTHEVVTVVEYECYNDNLQELFTQYTGLDTHL